MNKYVFILYFIRPTEENLNKKPEDLIESLVYIHEREVQKAHAFAKKTGTEFFFEDGKLFLQGEPLVCIHAESERHARDNAAKLIQAWMDVIKFRMLRHKANNPSLMVN